MYEDCKEDDLCCWSGRAYFWEGQVMATRDPRTSASKKAGEEKKSNMDRQQTGRHNEQRSRNSEHTEPDSEEGSKANVESKL